jgi:NAD(P) transhydrogenase
MHNRYDVVVIGSGPAGEGAAMKAVKEGRSRGGGGQSPEGGGELCALWAPSPPKRLRQTVWNLMRFQRDPLFQRAGAEIRNVPLSQVLASAYRVIDSQVNVHTRFYERNDVHMYIGTARFEGDHALSVLTPEGVREKLEFDNVVIATGSRPYQPE